MICRLKKIHEIGSLTVALPHQYEPMVHWQSWRIAYYGDLLQQCLVSPENQYVLPMWHPCQMKIIF